MHPWLGRTVTVCLIARYDIFCTVDIRKEQLDKRAVQTCQDALDQKGVFGKKEST